MLSSNSGWRGFSLSFFFCCYDLIFTLFIFSEKEKHQLINHLRVIPLCLWEKLLFYMFFLLFLAFGFRFSSKILMGFSDLVSDVVFGFFYLDSGSSSIWAAIFRFHGSLIAAKPILLHLSPLYRIDKGFDNQNVKICRFCVRFSVLIDIFLVFFVLSFFFLLFTVLRFWNIFFYGFAISNRPQCPPHRGN